MVQLDDLGDFPEPPLELGNLYPQYQCQRDPTQLRRLREQTFLK